MPGIQMHGVEAFYFRGRKKRSLSRVPDASRHLERSAARRSFLHEIERERRRLPRAFSERV